MDNSDNHYSFKDCSFCNLFLAIQSMMKELKGDHLRKGHYGASIQNPEENVVNSNSQMIPHVVTKKEKLTDEYIDDGNTTNNDDSKDIIESFVGVFGSFTDSSNTFTDDDDDSLNTIWDKMNIQSVTENENGSVQPDIENENGSAVIENENCSVQYVIENKNGSIASDLLQNKDLVKDLPLMKEGNKYKRSLIWGYFDRKNETKNDMECRSCGKVMKSHNGWNHLKSKHPSIMGLLSNKQNINIKQKTKSLVWEHFKPQKNSYDRVDCNHCGKGIFYASGTTNIIRHLTRKHPQVKEDLIKKQKENRGNLIERIDSDTKYNDDITPTGSEQSIKESFSLMGNDDTKTPREAKQWIGTQSKKDDLI